MLSLCTPIGLHLASFIESLMYLVASHIDAIASYRLGSNCIYGMSVPHIQCLQVFLETAVLLHLLLLSWLGQLQEKHIFGDGFGQSY